jgi:hypothetical protein
VLAVFFLDPLEEIADQANEFVRQRRSSSLASEGLRELPPFHVGRTSLHPRPLRSDGLLDRHDAIEIDDQSLAGESRHVRVRGNSRVLYLPESIRFDSNQWCDFEKRAIPTPSYDVARLREYGESENGLLGQSRLRGRG